MGLLQPQAEDAWCHPEREEARKEPPLRPPCRGHLDVSPPASRRARGGISAALSHEFGAARHGGHRTLNINACVYTFVFSSHPEAGGSPPAALTSKLSQVQDARAPRTLGPLTGAQRAQETRGRQGAKAASWGRF